MSKFEDRIESFKRKQELCSDWICMDGSVLDGVFCGIGECNAFSCNCDGGACRTNPKESYKEGVRLFIERTGY